MLDIKDWMRTDSSGKGIINILRIEEMEEEAASKEKELYDLKHELIASQIKLDNTEKSLRTLQQDQQESSRQIVRLETEIRGMKDKK